jgi:hypothetical protein
MNRIIIAESRTLPQSNYAVSFFCPCNEIINAGSAFDQTGLRAMDIYESQK